MPAPLGQEVGMPGYDGLFRGFFDDASLFPPASLPMSDAVTGHLRHEAAWYCEMSGPFVCADTRISVLSSALAAANAAALDLALVLPGGAAGLDAALDAVSSDSRLRLRAVEVPISASEADARVATAEVAAALDRVPLAGATAFIEIPPGLLSPEALRIAAEHRYAVKLRTGGVTAAAFPDETTLARCVTLLAGEWQAFKCTAGLHHAVRHRADDTGFEHHGFLNVLLAVAAALDGASPPDVAAVLADQDASHVAAAVRDLSRAAADEARGLFVSFGTCSIDEPISDLVALGLISEG